MGVLPQGLAKSKYQSFKQPFYDNHKITCSHEAKDEPANFQAVFNVVGRIAFGQICLDDLAV